MILNSDTQSLDLLLAIIGSVVAVIVTLAPLLIRTGKSSLRTDIEILNMLQKNPDYREDKTYKKIKRKIDGLILEVYPDSRISPLTRTVYVMSGVLFIGLFGYFTLNLVFSNFTFLSILTGYLTLTGIVYLLAGIFGRGKLFEILKLIPKTVEQDQ